jgi:hypothetical protein
MDESTSGGDAPLQWQKFFRCVKSESDDTGGQIPILFADITV